MVGVLLGKRDSTQGRAMFPSAGVNPVVVEGQDGKFKRFSAFPWWNISEVQLRGSDWMSGRRVVGL